MTSMSIDIDQTVNQMNINFGLEKHIIWYYNMYRSRLNLSRHVFFGYLKDTFYQDTLFIVIWGWNVGISGGHRLPWQTLQKFLTLSFCLLRSSDSLPAINQEPDRTLYQMAEFIFVIWYIFWQVAHVTGVKYSK